MVSLVILCSALEFSFSWTVLGMDLLILNPDLVGTELLIIGRLSVEGEMSWGCTDRVKRVSWVILYDRSPMELLVVLGLTLKL